MEEGIKPIKSLCAGWRREIYAKTISCLELFITTMNKKQFYDLISMKSKS